MVLFVESKKYNPLYTLAGGLLIWFLLYHQTLLSMLEIWWRSETFAHGFLIFPISIYLIWRNRAQFFITEKKFSIFFTICLLFLTIAWALARSVDVLVIQQLMVVLMIPAIIASLFGFKLLKQYFFPLLYLLFAVPFGEFLIPELQQMTAYMTVFGLELTGIPVYTEGLFISIPSGDFEVAVACSGIRYLIASLALGTLYAYLTYTKWYKQVIFVLASVLVPILANGIRAYGILMIAHLSGMKYATGVDHLIYGWLFFGVVIMLLFYVGSFWRDNDKIETTAVLNEQSKLLETSTRLRNSFLIIVFILLVGPVLNSWMSYQPAVQTITKVQVPKTTPPWFNKNNQPHNWTPSFKNADDEIITIFSNKKNSEEVFFYSSSLFWLSN
jgi:exosortase A